ncbi:hypothetical protein GCM10022212_11300 [Actimicrobium antarcticum]|uniref:Uncharacterized protein n=1 Tax=Actimicrobium antarcticum TaxID=1051899 RepID=A0ABP7SW66_9BURK
MIGMAVGDDGTVYCAPRVDVKLARDAVQAFGAGDYQVGHGGGVMVVGRADSGESQSEPELMIVQERGVVALFDLGGLQVCRVWNA